MRRWIHDVVSLRLIGGGLRERFFEILPAGEGRDQKSKKLMGRISNRSLPAVLLLPLSINSEDLKTALYKR